MNATIRCPYCSHAAAEVIPTDRCLFFYECKGCGRVLRPTAGDCCVFCSFADQRCDSKHGGDDDGRSD